MSNLYAIVEEGVVTNIVVWDGESEWDAPEGAKVVLAGSGAEIGGTYDGESFFPSEKLK